MEFKVDSNEYRKIYNDSDIETCYMLKEKLPNGEYNTTEHTNKTHLYIGFNYKKDLQIPDGIVLSSFMNEQELLNALTFAFHKGIELVHEKSRDKKEILSLFKKKLTELIECIDMVEEEGSCNGQNH